MTTLSMKDLISDIERITKYLEQFPILKEIVITKLAPLDAVYEKTIGKEIYLLIHPIVWQGLKSLGEDITSSSIVGISGIPVIESEIRAVEILTGIKQFSYDGGIIHNGGFTYRERFKIFENGREDKTNFVAS